MKDTSVRLVIAAVLIYAGYLSITMAQASLRLPPVRPFVRDIHELPRRLESWQGEDEELDPNIFERVGAESILNRIYRDDADHRVSMHLAIFKDPDAGVYHSPINCYRSAGWRLVEETRVELTIPGHPEHKQRINLANWERKDEKIWVAYWYRLGEHTLFERWDLGKLRWAMRGQASWPPMVKVLLQTEAADKFPAKTRILEMARLIQGWIDESEAATRSPAGKPPAGKVAGSGK
jgi:EpsI family protein